MSRNRGQKDSTLDAGGGVSVDLEKIDSIVQKAVAAATKVLNDEFQRLINELSERVSTLTADVGNLRKVNSELKVALNTQSQYMEQLEAYSKGDNLIIHGLPSTMAEVLNAADGDAVNIMHESSAMTESTFVGFCKETLAVDVKPSDISICHRVKKSEKEKYPPIMVRFVNRKTREAVLNARYKLKTLNTERRERVYVNEHLTRSAGKINAAARKLFKDGKLQKVWIKNGRIIVKTLNERITTVTTMTTLENLE